MERVGAVCLEWKGRGVSGGGSGCGKLQRKQNEGWQSCKISHPRIDWSKVKAQPGESRCVRSGHVCPAVQERRCSTLGARKCQQHLPQGDTTQQPHALAGRGTP